MIIIRTAHPADADVIHLLVNSAYRGEGSKRGWTTEADLLGGQRTDREKVLEVLTNPDMRIELAYDDDQLIGCVQLTREPAGSCYLGMLTVDPGRQAAGLGSRLLSHGEQVAREWGCASMRITVIHLRDELLRYYERRGYRLTGAVEPFPTDPRYGLPRTELKLLVLAKPLHDPR
jgi:predicted N-acetyltransferase YhbS